MNLDRAIVILKELMTNGKISANGEYVREDIESGGNSS